MFNNGCHIERCSRLGLLAITLFSLMGCEPLLIPDVPHPAALPLDIRPPPKRDGTIYQQGFEVQLYEDVIARRVGDVLTIRLEEANKGEARAKTRTEKRASLNYPIPVVFGQSVPALEIQTDTEQRFDSKGDSDQSNKLTGMISVTVMQVLPNHSLAIQGESWVTINQSREFIQLTGIVRLEDIQPNNVVSSQRVAQAQIRFGAKGQAGYATQGGLVTQLFNRFALY